MGFGQFVLVDRDRLALRGGRRADRALAGHDEHPLMQKGSQHAEHGEFASAGALAAGGEDGADLVTQWTGGIKVKAELPILEKRFHGGGYGAEVNGGADDDA